jgi:hypothetical protein
MSTSRVFDMTRTTETEVLDQQMRPPVSLLSFMDCFRGIWWLTSTVVPSWFLIRRFKPAGKAPAAH